MLEAALALVESQGLTVSLDHLSLENVIARADVSRSSAYRRWPYKDLFLADLLVAVARDTDLTVEPPGLVDALRALIASADLSDGQARRDLLIEALRMSSASEFERIWLSPRWRTYLALSATVTGLPAGPIREAAASAVLDAERRFASRRAGVYRNLAAMIGYRISGGLDAEAGFEFMASTSGAVMTGYVVKALVDEQLATDNDAAARHVGQRCPLGERARGHARRPFRAGTNMVFAVPYRDRAAGRPRHLAHRHALHPVGVGHVDGVWRSRFGAQSARTRRRSPVCAL